MSLYEIKPIEQRRIMDLVMETGIDVSDWANVKGGAARAAVNPKYCYEWSYVEPDHFIVLNLWHAEMTEVAGVVSSSLNLRKTREIETNAQRKTRAAKTDHAIAEAFTEGLPVRVIVLSGTRRDPETEDTEVKKRLLDPKPWSVATYDFQTGECHIVRGRHAVPATAQVVDDVLAEFMEGEERRRFVRHRKREARLRAAKLTQAKQQNNGRLICEVPKCGFDFAATYGELGMEYAQVHHLEPLSSAPETGRCTTLEKLAVVCANCHAMIHRGGQCRNLNDLIP